MNSTGVTVKSKPLSKDETKALLELIEKSSIITTKTTNATNNSLKIEEWKKIASLFNSTSSSCPRTHEQLRLKWENLKKNARKRSTKIRMNNMKTGGGSAEYIPPDEVLDRVASILGSTVSGFTVPFGGDSEPMEFVGDGDLVIGDGGDLIIGGAGDLIIGGGGDLIIGGGGGVGGTLVNDLELEDQPGPSTSSQLCPSNQPDKTSLSTAEPKRFTFNSFTSARRANKGVRQQADNSKSAKNMAIAQYFSLKKKFLEEKYINIQLENEKLKLELEKLNKEAFLNEM